MKKITIGNYSAEGIMNKKSLVYLMHFSLLICSIFISFDSTANQKKHVIGIGSHRKGGLFYNFLGALNNIRYAESKNMVPVVLWDAPYLYFEKGHGGTDNIWEYYFEPVSSAHYEENDTIWPSNEAPDNRALAPTRFSKCHQYEAASLRKQMSEIIKKYIRVKPSIQQKIDQFYQENMAGKITIGIHLRGTDKKDELQYTFDPEIMLHDANKLAADFPGCQFFIATDEEKLLKKAQNILQGKVLYCPAQRSLNGSPIHYSKQKNKAHLGEEVIIEALLLSRCNMFLHTCSSVSTAVLFFNPTLKNQLYPKQQLKTAKH